jgi:dCTP deaminase
MSILSDKDILDEMKLGNVVIDSFNMNQLGPNTYNTTLGEWYYTSNYIKPDTTDWHKTIRHENDNVEKPKYINPDNGESIAKYWNVSLDSKLNYGAYKAVEIMDTYSAKNYYTDIGKSIILLWPGELILGHTIEYIGGRNNITTVMSARSTMGRCGLSVCKCAGTGDVGYIQRWTMEFENHADVPQVLEVGSQKSQITFHRTGPVMRSYESRGQYQTSNNLDDMKKNWTPLNMIPKKAIEYLNSNPTVSSHE